MAQSSPTSLLYGQALALINSLKRQYSVAKDGDPIQVVEAVNIILEKFHTNAGNALTEFNPIVHSEIPSSAKFNRFLGGVQTDVNLMEDQIDTLRANAVSTHNLIKTEILKAQNENKKLQNKLKTLELYSNVNDNSILYFGDSFISEDSVDWEAMSPDTERANILSSGYLSLGISSLEEQISTDCSIKILDGSNGFLGNNQEIDWINPQAINTPEGSDRFHFKAELSRHASLADALDSMPVTWFEFEKYLVPEKNRLDAKNYNFSYSFSNSKEVQYLKSELDVQISEVPWANGPSGGALRLNLEIDIKQAKLISIITFTPFGLIDNSNNPIKIIEVAVSENKNDWDIISPQNVWIVNSINRKISFSNLENISVGSAAWTTAGSMARYIRFKIIQPNPIDCNIGHLYYIPKDAEIVSNTKPTLPSNSFTSELLKYEGPLFGYYHDFATPIYEATPSTGATPSFYRIPYNNVLYYGGIPPEVPVGLQGYSDYIINQEGVNPTYYYEAPLPYENLRQQGPIPSVDAPDYYYLNEIDVDTLIQKVEYFRGKRWVIGVRDINAQSIIFNQRGTFISKKFNIPRTVDRVALDADIDIPTDFSGSDWIKFYVSPNDGLDWFRISRIQDNYSDIPEIIAFNDPVSQEMRENGVNYVNVDGQLNSIRVKIEINRPDTLQYLSPIIKSYKLKVIKR